MAEVYIPQEAHEHHTQYIPERVAAAIQLNGNVRRVEPLRFGMSGANIIRVDRHDDDPMIIKFSDKHPYRVVNEIVRHGMLTETPLQPYLLPLLYASREHAIIAYPFFQGVQVREGIRTGEVEQENVEGVFTDLLAVKRDWWGNQEKRFGSREHVSMQREEWQDTLKGISQTIQGLERTYGVSAKDILEEPMRFEGNTYRPFQETVTRVGAFLADNPPYTILAHNDATGANIIYNIPAQRWKLLDPEWTGPSDPAEAYVRMVKYITSSTARGFSEASLDETGSTVVANISVDFPKTALHLQNLGLSQGPDFAHALQDPAFMERAGLYLSGSYLREVALATRRGTLDAAIFAMVKASEVLAA